MSAKEKTAEKPSADNKYTVEALRASCAQLFGVSTATFDGALYKQKERISIKEAQKLIDEFKNKKIGGKA